MFFLGTSFFILGLAISAVILAIGFKALNDYEPARNESWRPVVGRLSEEERKSAFLVPITFSQGVPPESDHFILILLPEELRTMSFGGLPRRIETTIFFKKQIKKIFFKNGLWDKSCYIILIYESRFEELIRIPMSTKDFEQIASLLRKYYGDKIVNP